METPCVRFSCIYLAIVAVLLALLLVVIVCLVTQCVLRFVASGFNVLFSSFEHDLFLWENARKRYTA